MAKRKHSQDQRLANGSVIYWSRRQDDKVPVQCGACGRERLLFVANVVKPAASGLCHECACIAMRKHAGVETLPTGSVVYWNKRQGLGKGQTVPVRCGACGQVRTVPANKAAPNGFTGYCLRCSRTGSRAPRWKSGRFKTPEGYVRIRLTPEHPFFSMAGENRSVLEHRLVMAEHLGRPLRKDELVHHKNGVKDDNRLENLELLSKRLHHPGSKLDEHADKTTEDNLWAEIVKLIQILIPH